MESQVGSTLLISVLRWWFWFTYLRGRRGKEQCMLPHQSRGVCISLEKRRSGCPEPPVGRPQQRREEHRLVLVTKGKAAHIIVPALVV